MTPAAESAYSDKIPRTAAMPAVMMPGLPATGLRQPCHFLSRTEKAVPRRTEIDAAEMDQRSERAECSTGYESFVWRNGDSHCGMTPESSRPAKQLLLE